MLDITHLAAGVQRLAKEGFDPLTVARPEQIPVTSLTGRRAARRYS